MAVHFINPNGRILQVGPLGFHCINILDLHDIYMVIKYRNIK